MKLGLKTRFSKPILKRHSLWDSVDVTALKWQNYWLTDWQLGRVKRGATTMQEHEETSVVTEQFCLLTVAGATRVCTCDE